MENGHLNIATFTPIGFARFCAELLGRSLRGPGDAFQELVSELRGFAMFRLRDEDVYLVCMPMAATWAQLEPIWATLAAQLPVVERLYIGTALHLTPRRKRAISRRLPALRAEQDIFSIDDWEGMLARHPELIRKQPRLWKGHADELLRRLQAEDDRDAEQERQYFLQEICDALRCFALPPQAEEAMQRLKREKALIITGEPGIGKTTLAYHLMRQLIVEDGYEPINLRSNICEAYRRIRPDRKQVFLFDDFLGESFYLDHLHQNEDGRIAAFIDHLRRSSGKLIILTSREYIFRQAGAAYEAFREENTELFKLGLRICPADEAFRSDILHRHLLHHGFSHRRITSLQRPMRGGNGESALQCILNHPNFNPRVLDTALTRLAKLSPRCDLGTRLLQAFRNPYELYVSAFRDDLNDAQRRLLLLLSTHFADCPISALHRAADTGKGAPPEAPEDSLRVLLGSFITTRPDRVHRHLVNFINPGVRDFCLRYLYHHPQEILGLIRGGDSPTQLHYLLCLYEYHLCLPPVVKQVLRERAKRHLQNCQEKGILTPVDFDILAQFAMNSRLMSTRADKELVAQLLQLESEQGGTPLSDARLLGLHFLLHGLSPELLRNVRWENILVSLLHHAEGILLPYILLRIEPLLREDFRDGSAIRPLVETWTMRYCYKMHGLTLTQLCAARDAFRNAQHTLGQRGRLPLLCGIDTETVLTQLRRYIRRRRQQERRGQAQA